MSQEILNAFTYLESNQANMTPGQISFTGSLLKWYKKKKGLSNFQAYVLFEIKNHVERSVLNKEKQKNEGQI
jgi:hypothetical protein